MRDCGRSLLATRLSVQQQPLSMHRCAEVPLRLIRALSRTAGMTSECCGLLLGVAIDMHMNDQSHETTLA